MSILFQLNINADVTTLFNAVTTKKGYQGWWAVVCDIDCKLNKLSSIRFKKENLIEEMIFKTLEIEKNKKLVWQCTFNNVFETWVGTILTFEISRKRGGSLLKFSQTSPDKNWEKHSDFPGSLAGWKFFMGSLKNYCETGTGEPWG